MQGRAHVAHYGNICMLRMECPDCKRVALVIDGRMACCDLCVSCEPKYRKQMSEAAIVRRKPKSKDQKVILKRQEGRCLYCDRCFDSAVYRNGRKIRLRLHWDHMVPYVYSRNNNNANFVAACHVCNGIKAARMFDDVEEARIYINEKRQAKGYTDAVSELREGLPRETPLAKVL